MIKKILFSLFIFLSLLNNANADVLNSPVGNWITISQSTNERISIVKIWQQNGILYGKVIKIFPGPNQGYSDLCVNCKGVLKNKPIVGMIVLWGFVDAGNGRWINGGALDPHTGNTYRGSMQLLADGRLKLTGYWGIFWRTQTWLRAGPR